jgi:hypothetical protein
VVNPRALLALVAVGVTACGTDVTTFPGGDGGDAPAEGGGGSVPTGGSGASAGSSQGGTGAGASGHGGGIGPGGSGQGGFGDGGSGEGGFGEGGSSPFCKTCGEALEGAPGPLCPGSEMFFDAVVSCACETGCPEICAPTCAGMDDGPACDACMDMACSSQLEACFAN